MRISLAGFLLLGVAWLFSGCDGDNGVSSAPPPQPPDVPTLDAEPAFSPGASNTLSWSGKLAPAAEEYLAQRATDGDFTTEVVESPWVTQTSFEFNGLQDGITYFYRVKARAGETESNFSAAVSSTQDATPPTSSLIALAADQTTLTFEVEFTASDAGSGVQEVELWYRRDGGAFARFGTFTQGPVSFQAPGGGEYEFYTIAIDAVGNTEQKPAVGEAFTSVPELIIITDQDGKDWDITHAVNEYGMHVGGWQYGLGQNTIQPILFPDRTCPGDAGHPGSDQVFIVLGVSANGVDRGYRIRDLLFTEVVDDIVGGAHLAVTY